MMNHDWEKKCWGLTRLIFCNAHHSLHELMVVAGWQCSRHLHHERANSFFVDSGRIRIVTYGVGGNARELGPRDSIEVPSLVWHRFQVLESGCVFETYWPDSGGVVRLDDIERVDEGGRFAD